MRHRFRVALHDTDAAGVLFYAHLFRHLHDAYELGMAELGFPLDRLIRAGDLALPLVHAEADYRAPMRHGDLVTIVGQIVAVEAARFRLAYRCIAEVATGAGTGDGVLLATAATVHACIDPRLGRARPLPDELAEALRAALETRWA